MSCRNRAALVLIAGAGALAAIGCYDPGVAGTQKHQTWVQDWRDEVIYQVLTDRFADGDTSNDYNLRPNDMARYHGGDWKGVEDHLDYLSGLGVTTLWISPIVKNVESDASIDGYHGYWAQDLTALNPHMGDLGALRSLVDTAHGLGMKVILDIVTNHVGQVFFYDINGNGVPDEAVWGGGQQGQDLPTTPIMHRSEYDPEYEEPQVMSRTSLGIAGPAPVIFYHDAPSNHMPPVSGYPPGASFDVLQMPEAYHRRGRVYNWGNDHCCYQWFNNLPLDTSPDPNYDCPTQVANDVCNQVRFGDFPGGLKDVASEWTEVRNAMFYAYGRWLTLVDFDGFRIDTLKHVEHEFWQDFAPRIRQYAADLGKKRFFMFGEAFSGDDQLIGSYTFNQEVDSVFYFSQKYTIDDVFKNGRATVRLKNLYDQRAKDFSSVPQDNGVEQPPTKVLVNFLDNHDVARFLYDKPSVPALHSALVFLLTEDGIPCIYYGTEQDFHGGNDPANREDMWSTNYNRSNQTYRFIAALNAIRRKYEPLRRGDMLYRAWTEAPAGQDDANMAGVLAFERFTSPENRVLVAINTSDTDSKPAVQANGDPMVTGFAEGTVLVNVAPDADPNDQVTVGPGGTVQLTIGPRVGKIFVPQNMQ